MSKKLERVLYKWQNLHKIYHQIIGIKRKRKRKNEMESYKKFIQTNKNTRSLILYNENYLLYYHLNFLYFLYSNLPSYWNSAIKIRIHNQFPDRFQKNIKRFFN